MVNDPTAIDIDFNPLTQRMRGVARHGNVPFDVPFISHIKDNLYQGGCETGLILPRNIKHLISLYPWERYIVAHDLDSELYFRMYDDVNQGFKQVYELALYVLERAQTGPVLLHCQAGLNRSALVAATALHLYDGRGGEAAIDLLRTQRSPAVLCNPAFEKWVLEL